MICRRIVVIVPEGAQGEMGMCAILNRFVFCSGWNWQSSSYRVVVQPTVPLQIFIILMFSVPV